MFLKLQPHNSDAKYLLEIIWQKAVEFYRSRLNNRR